MIPDRLFTILSGFDSIGLKELEKVSLQNRLDTKYIFSSALLSTVLEKMQPDYSCLEINRNRISSYQTDYYDTDGLLFYNQHHNDLYNRVKVRKRLYKNTGISFLEVKQKTNKNRTVKKRLKIEKDKAPFDESQLNFLRNSLQINPSLLKATVQVDYERLTFSGKNGSERATLDFNLKFHYKGESLYWDKIVIAELKQEKRSRSVFTELMKSLHVQQSSLSKYCLGMASCDAGLKQNNFKSKILTISKIQSHDNFASRA